MDIKAGKESGVIQYNRQNSFPTTEILLEDHIYSTIANSEEYLLSLADESETAEEIIFKRELKVLVALVLSRLTARERVVVVGRYGLDGDEPKRLEDLSVMLKVGRERIRQIEHKAIRKLKHPDNLRLLGRNPNPRKTFPVFYVPQEEPKEVTPDDHPGWPIFCYDDIPGWPIFCVE